MGAVITEGPGNALSEATGSAGAPLVGALSSESAEPIANEYTWAGTRPAPTTVGDIVGVFKSVTTHE